MRLLHTADWHLGRVFHRVDLLEDQRHALDQLVRLADQHAVDAVLVAGDVYDRAVPPAAAVQLLDETLSRLVVELRIPTILVAGNHDSVERLAFGSRLLSQQQLHVRGPLTPELVTVPIVLHDDDGPLEVFAVPYPEPALVRERLAEPEARSHQRAMDAVLARVRAARCADRRAVLVTHADVEGGRLSDSERPLSVARAQAVSAGTFDGFDYVALGHLHRPQTVGGEGVQYAGSILAYSFSEAGDDKSVTLVDLGREEMSTRRLPLVPRRRVRLLEGTMKQLLRAGDDDPRRDDYLRITLRDEGPVVETMARLREVYPNVLEVDRPYVTRAATPGAIAARATRREQSEVELFAAFFEHATGERMDEALACELRRVVDSLGGGERRDEEPP